MTKSFRASGATYNVTFEPLSKAGTKPGPRKAAGASKTSGGAKGASGERLLRAIHASKKLSSRLQSGEEVSIVHVSRASAGPRGVQHPPVSERGAKTLATSSVILEGFLPADLKAAKDFGAKVIDEGSEGKVLLRADSVAQAFDLAAALHARGVGAASPNFMRYVTRPSPSSAAVRWAHAAIGLKAAWGITRGKSSIRIAILDEGVDATHPALQAALVAQRDFIGPNGASAQPSGDDAHGTACAGIAVARGTKAPGVAPLCSLVAARIGMGDGADGWVYDDFATADAIDWCWRDQHADVLSNSWGGGAPNDAVTRAIRRAQGNGRGSNGAVVVFAAGNVQSPIDYPGSLRSVITVGASNQFDERKTTTSRDGEGWGSNYGPSLDLLAPGVAIDCTDIVGASGYEPGDYTSTFNGTSAATPHVAGAAALMLSLRPNMTAVRVRDLLVQNAKLIDGQTGWTPTHGWGRLDVAAAVRAADAEP